MKLDSRNYPGLTAEGATLGTAMTNAEKVVREEYASGQLFKRQLKGRR